jgi:hypothetical protein
MKREIAEKIYERPRAKKDERNYTDRPIDPNGLDWLNETVQPGCCEKGGGHYGTPKKNPKDHAPNVATSRTVQLTLRGSYFFQREIRASGGHGL